MTIPVCVCLLLEKKVHRTEFIFLKWLFFFESMNESHILMIGIFYFESKTTTTTTKKRGHNISMYYLFVTKTKRLMIPIFSIFPIVFILL